MAAISADSRVRATPFFTRTDMLAIETLEKGNGPFPRKLPVEPPKKERLFAGTWSKLIKLRTAVIAED